MPAISNTANFKPNGPGKGIFILLQFKNSKEEFGSNTPESLEIFITKEGRKLADWPTDSHEGFIKIDNIKGKQQGVDFRFEVGPSIVDLMASDSVGAYILNVKGINGNIHKFLVDLKGDIISSYAMRPKIEAGPDNRTVFDQSVKVEAKTIKVNNANQSSAPKESNFKSNNIATFALNNAQSNLQSPNASQTSPKSDNIGSFDNKADNLNNSGISSSTKTSVHSQSPSNASAQHNNANQSSSKMPIAVMKIVGAICILLLLIGAVFFVMNLINSKSPSQEETSNINQACSLEKASGDDKSIINNCLASNPSVDDLNNLLLDAIKQDRCEIVLRVLRTKGRSANGGMYAYIYSKYADPSSAYKSKCINKSQDDATYWADRVKSDQNFNQSQADDLLNKLK